MECCRSLCNPSSLSNRSSDGSDASFQLNNVHPYRLDPYNSQVKNEVRHPVDGVQIIAVGSDVHDEYATTADYATGYLEHVEPAEGFSECTVKNEPIESYGFLYPDHSNSSCHSHQGNSSFYSDTSNSSFYSETFNSWFYSDATSTESAAGIRDILPVGESSLVQPGSKRLRSERDQHEHHTVEDVQSKPRKRMQPPKVPCPVCFITKCKLRGLKIHLRESCSDHADASILSACSICGRTFVSKEAFVEHLCSHGSTQDVEVFTAAGTAEYTTTVEWLQNHTDGAFSRQMNAFIDEHPDLKDKWASLVGEQGRRLSSPWWTPSREVRELKRAIKGRVERGSIHQILYRLLQLAKGFSSQSKLALRGASNSDSAWRADGLDQYSTAGDPYCKHSPDCNEVDTLFAGFQSNSAHQCALVDVRSCPPSVELTATTANGQSLADASVAQDDVSIHHVAPPATAAGSMNRPRDCRKDAKRPRRNS